MQNSNRIGIVVIGRNEGERLRRCLQSVIGKASHVVYVDSASTDGSIELARSFGIEVIELDPSKPFASPRSRNEGFYHLLKIDPAIQYVQFIDGDCELIDGWIESAKDILDSRPDVAVVCGRRRERFPDASVYNRLCDIEWNTPVGEAISCGGDALMRPDVFQSVGGFSETLIGGGEPELCVRFRQAGWKILRIDCDMTFHDADIHRFSQWWNRSRRCGHAYAEGAWLHGLSPQKHWLKETISNLSWGLFIPLLSLGMAWPTQGLSLLLLGVYPLLIVRICIRSLQQKMAAYDALIYAVFCVLIKFPMMLGQLQFYFNHFRGRHTKLVEYKAFKPIDMATELDSTGRAD